MSLGARDTTDTQTRVPEKEKKSPGACVTLGCSLRACVPCLVLFLTGLHSRLSSSMSRGNPCHSRSDQEMPFLCLTLNSPTTTPLTLCALPPNLGQQTSHQQSPARDQDPVACLHNFFTLALFLSLTPFLFYSLHLHPSPPSPSSSVRPSAPPLPPSLHLLIYLSPLPPSPLKFSPSLFLSPSNVSRQGR